MAKGLFIGATKKTLVREDWKSKDIDRVLLPDVKTENLEGMGDSAQRMYDLGIVLMIHSLGTDIGNLGRSGNVKVGMKVEEQSWGPRKDRLGRCQKLML